MSGVAELYNQFVAKSFNRDRFGIFGEGRRLALSQLAGKLPATSACLDIGCGTGLFLRELGALLPLSQLFGLDPSTAMLELAMRESRIRGVVADANAVEGCFTPGQFDLIAMHFVLAYLDPPAALARVRRLLKPGGVLSLVTSTYDSLRAMQRLAETLSANDAKTSAHVPANADALIQLLESQGFCIEASEPFERPLTLTSFDDFYDFAVRSSWLVQHIALIEKFGQMPKEALAPFFPFHDCLVAVAVTARKM